MTASANEINAASESLFEAICDGLSNERGIHLETAITAAGYLAGYEILRAANVDLSQMTPGSSVFNAPGVDETGPVAMQFVLDACRNTGLPGPADPGQQVPNDHRPLQSYLELMGLFKAAHARILAAVQLPPTMQWVVAAQTAVRFIVAGKGVLRPEIGQMVALEAIVAGAKTVPPADEASR